MNAQTFINKLIRANDRAMAKTGRNRIPVTVEVWGCDKDRSPNLRDVAQVVDRYFDEKGDGKKLVPAIVVVVGEKPAPEAKTA